MWDNIVTVGFFDLIVSIGLNRSMFVIPLTTGSIFLLNVRRCIKVFCCVPISISHPGLKKSAQGSTTSAWCKMRTEARRESEMRAVLTNGASKDIADDKNTVTSLQLMQWSQTCSVHWRNNLQRTPYEAPVKWWDAWKTSGIFSGTGIEKMKRSRLSY